MSEYDRHLNFKKCRYCGHRPQKDIGTHCTKCGKPYKEVYSKDDKPTAV